MFPEREREIQRVSIRIDHLSDRIDRLSNRIDRLRELKEKFEEEYDDAVRPARNRGEVTWR